MALDDDEAEYQKTADVVFLMIFTYEMWLKVVAHGFAFMAGACLE